MEQKFQTAFIPKKSFIPDSPAKSTGWGGSIFKLFATLIFIVSLLSAGGVKFWQYTLEKKITEQRTALEFNRSRFGADIQELKRFNAKISNVQQLIDNHLAVSNIFTLIARVTVENVRFKSLDFSMPAQSTDNVIISLKGEAKDYQTIAFQSDFLSTNTVIQNPVIADLDQADNGIVSFSFSGAIDPKLILYKRAFETDVQVPDSAPVEAGARSVDENI